MGTKLGYNLLGVANREAFLAHVEKTRPPALLFYQNEVALARECKSRWPAMHVILRHWPDHEHHLHYSPAQYISMMRPFADGGLAINVLNEAGLSDAVLNWTLEVMRLALAAQMRLVVLNPATGTFGLQEFTRAKKIVQLAGERPDLFAIGLHEYAGGIITSGLVGGNPDDTRYHPDYTRRELWPEQAGALTCWHIGRHRFLWQFCRNAGLPRPRVIVTETGFDYTEDIGAWLNGLPRSGDINGYKSLEAAWRRWFPDWGRDEAYARQLRWAEAHLLNDVDAALIFGYGKDPNWAAYNIEGTSVPEWLEKTLIKPLPTPAPAPVPEPPAPQPEPIPPAPAIDLTPLGLAKTQLKEARDRIDSALVLIDKVTGG